MRVRGEGGKVQGRKSILAFGVARGELTRFDCVSAFTFTLFFIVDAVCWQKLLAWFSLFHATQINLWICFAVEISMDGCTNTSRACWIFVSIKPTLWSKKCPHFLL